MLTTVISTLLLSAPLAGVKVQVVRPGTGLPAAKGDVLTVMYKGTLATGKTFDSNYGRAPFAFRLGAGQVIKGWEQGLAGIKAGTKVKLIIPPELGYGREGMGPVPAHAILHFDLEVLRIDRDSDRPKVRIVDIVKGTGEAVGPESDVKVHYKGTFINGVIFDATKSKPFAFRLGVGAVARGFEEAVRTMRVGGKRKAIVPYRLGYGEKGKQPYVPRFATLVFELQLVEILK